MAGFVLAAVTACGTEQQGTTTTPAAQSNFGPVGTRDLPGVGTVLVDTAGKTLYFTDQDMMGSIKCVGDCNSLWTPATAPAQAQGTDFGTIQRPDGKTQLTFQNKPLYTFMLDKPDQPAFGNNAKDSFGGVDFTWHAIVVKPGSAPTTTDDGGYNGGQNPGGY